jgi:hypothetical protein
MVAYVIFFALKSLDNKNFLGYTIKGSRCIMAFLNLSAIKKLKDGLLEFIKTQASKVERKDFRLYFLMEPEEGTVHIVQGLNLVQHVIQEIKEKGGKLLEFSSGLLYRRIPRSVYSWGLTLDSTYTKVRSWGDIRKRLTFQALIKAGKTIFKMENDQSIHTDEKVSTIDASAALSSIISNRKAAAHHVLSDLFIRDCIDNCGLFIDHEYKDRLMKEIKDALSVVRMKLATDPDLRGATA